ncbi:MAG: DegT/DnrJ/EryC1/StrS family aminotransferase [Spirosomataceae bacterium]
MEVQTLTIPFLDLKKQYQQIKEEVLEATQKVFSETAFSGGKYVEQFERNFATYCGTNYAMACNNGTTALHLAMLAIGVGEGDEVIVPANTFIASAWGVSHAGATPVFVDCTSDTWEIDPNKIEEKITSQTKAIIGVHLYGQPFDIDRVRAIADKHNLFLIEDAAQAHGAYYKGQKVGKFGDLACFSFYPGKNLGAYGEAGGLTTNNERYYQHINKLKNHGSTQRYYHDEIGYNMRMDGLQGAILDIKLRYLDEWNNRRREIANMYFNQINNPKIQFQKQLEGTQSAYHLFVITTNDREQFMKYLADNSIVAGLHYPVPCHLQKAYNFLGYKKGDMPNAEYLAEHCVTLPMFAELEDEEVLYIIETINNY